MTKVKKANIKETKKVNIIYTNTTRAKDPELQSLRTSILDMYKVLLFSLLTLFICWLMALHNAVNNSL